MRELLDAITAATAPDATDEARAAGAAACRTLLAALDAKPGEPLAQPAPHLGAAIAALRSVPPDQLLDLAIAKLRTMVPAEAQPAKVEPVKFRIIELPASTRRMR